MTLLTAQNTIAWHDRSTDQHKALVDDWAGKGFRTLSLSVYGTPQDPRYASVMVKRPAVIATKAFYSRTQAGIQQAFDEMARQGWGPYILTATGPAANPVFAGVFTPMNAIPVTRLSLTGQQFADLNEAQQAAGRILLWADAFGTPDDTRYTAIWGPNPAHEAWNVDALDEGGADLQARFTAMQSSWARPALVSVTPSGRHMEMFVDSVIGRWSSRVGMTRAEYQAEFDARAADGLFRSGCRRRGGRRRALRPPSSPRATRPSRAPPRAGAGDGGGDRRGDGDVPARPQHPRDLAGRGAGTRLVYAKGYTFAEASYPDLAPTTRYRQASISKAFAAVAIWRLIQQKQLTLDTTLQSVLNLTQPDGTAPKDPRFKDVRIRHLLESTSGINQGLVWACVEAAAAATGRCRPRGCRSRAT
jgi:hypothetical protein